MNWKEWQGLSPHLMPDYYRFMTKKQVEGLQMFSEFAQERSPLLAYNAKWNHYKQDGLCSYKLFWTDIIINSQIVLLCHTALN